MKIKFLLLGWCLLPVLLLAEKALTVVPLAGEEQTVLLSKIGKLYFSNDTVYLYAHNGVLLGETCVLDIRKIVFVDAETAVENVSADVVRVYPNPAMDYLVVEGLPERTMVRVFSLDGRLMLEQSAGGNPMVVQVGELPAGTWLLQMNTSLVKFVKK